MIQRFGYTGDPATFPLFPGKYRVTLAQPKTNVAGDVLEGTIDIKNFAWGFVNVGSPNGFNEGSTDFRIRTNVRAEIVMATPGDNSQGYMSGHSDHDVHYRGYVFEDIAWHKKLNIDEGYARIETLEKYESDKDLFHLRSYYNVGDIIELVLPNNQTLNRVDYKINGVWREIYRGRDTIVRVDTSRTNRAGKIRYRAEIDGQFVTIGESKDFVVGGKSELDVSVNLSANNRFYGTMDAVPPPYYTHNLLPIKDSLVREKAPHVNYGDSSSLTIGKSEAERENFETFLSYSLENAPVGEDIDYAGFDFSLAKFAEGPLEVVVYESGDDWQERTVRWENKPKIGDEIFRGTVEINKGKVEIDLTEYITDWYLNGGEARSFAVMLITEDDKIVYFGSKESNFPPYLRISYYKVPPNAGVYYMDADVLVSIRTSDYLEVDVELDSDFNVSDLDVDLEFEKKVPDPVEIPADVLVSIIDVSDLLSDVEFEAKHNKTEIDVDTYLRGFVVSEIGSEAIFENKHIGADLDVDLVIALNDESELEADVNIPIKELVSDLEVDMFLRSYGNSDMNATAIFFEKPGGSQIDADCEIRAYGDLEMIAEVEFVAKPGDTEKPADVEFFEKEAYSELDTNMILSIRWASELEVDVDVQVISDNDFSFIL